MLEPQDRVRIDGGERTWTIAKVTRRSDAATGKETNYYTLADWPNPGEELPAHRISGVVSST
jgi:hypothetical protein